jgi:AcrR family transcriptional regulator
MLIEVAAEMFAERGYVETSMRDIANRASLTTGALYGHFRNKAELLAEAISTRISEEFERDRPKSLDVRSMRASLKDFVMNFQKRQELRALLLQGAAAAQTDDETRVRLRDEQRLHLDRWFKDYEADRDLLGFDRSVDIEAFSLFTWSAEIGLGLLEVLGIAPSPDGWADVYDRLVRGLRLPPEE